MDKFTQVLEVQRRMNAEAGLHSHCSECLSIGVMGMRCCGMYWMNVEKTRKYLFDLIDVNEGKLTKIQFHAKNPDYVPGTEF